MGWLKSIDKGELYKAIGRSVLLTLGVFSLIAIWVGSFYIHPVVGIVFSVVVFISYITLLFYLVRE